MNPKPIHGFLNDFSLAPVSSAIEFLEHDAEAERQAEIAAAREEAYAQGLKEGLLRAEGALEAERERAAAELAEARRAWVDGDATALQTRLVDGLCALRTDVCNLVAQVLAKFLDEAMERKAIDALAEELRQYLSDDRQPVLRISGPAGLIEALRNKISGAAMSVDLVSNGDAEVAVTDGATRFSTRLEHWRNALSADIESGVSDV
ncbi:MAG: hypothetical protein ACK4MV_10875 [Beijerinckiaceae bacterium]